MLDLFNQLAELFRVRFLMGGFQLLNILLKLLSPGGAGPARSGSRSCRRILKALFHFGDQLTDLFQVVLFEGVLDGGDLFLTLRDLRASGPSSLATP